MAFVTFIVPLILKDIKAASKLPVFTRSSSIVLAVEPYSDDDEGGKSDAAEGKSVYDALGRLENEVLTMRNDMTDKLNAALNIDPSNVSLDGSHNHLEVRLDSLEKLLNENTRQHTLLTASIDKLTVALEKSNTPVTVNLDNLQLEKLSCDLKKVKEAEISSITTTVQYIKNGMAQASALSGVEAKVDNLTTLQEQMSSSNLQIQNTINDMKDNIKTSIDASKNEMALLRKNSDDSLTVLKAMMNSLKNIENGAATVKQPSTNPPSLLDTQSASLVEVPRRKGIMFTSSLALETDKKLYEDINCDLKIVPTYHIEENLGAKEPEAFLGNMVTQHLRGNTEYDFAIIATGTNDISNLDLETVPVSSLYSKVSTQSQTLFDVAAALTEEMHIINVFIVDKPPRYDVMKDQSGMRQKLSKYSNGVLASLTGATPKIFLVEQSSLGRASERARADIYQKDGLHLTKKGVNFYNDNIISVMKECYPDTEEFQNSSCIKSSENQQTNYQGRISHRKGGFDVGPNWDHKRSPEWRNHNRSFRAGRGNRHNDRGFFNQGLGNPWQFHNNRWETQASGQWGYDRNRDFPPRPQRDFGGGYRRGRY